MATTIFGRPRRGGPTLPTEEEIAESRRNEEAEHENARRFISRAIFAWFCITVFVTGLAGLEWRLAIASSLVILVVVAALVRLNIGAGLLNRILVRPFISTNNLWLLWLTVLMITMFTIMVRTPVGQHQAYETSRTYADRLNDRTAKEKEERLNNLRTLGEDKTNAELGLKSTVSAEEPSWEGSVPDDQQRKKHFIRVMCWLTLLLLTTCYIGFAFSDEVRDAWHTGVAKAREKSEGITAKQVVQTAASAAAPTVLAAAAGAGGAGHSFIQTIGREFTYDAAFEFFKEFFQRFARGLRRRAL
jgi:hypothetical protein